MESSAGSKGSSGKRTFTLFPSSVFAVKHSGWAVEDVVKSGCPWFCELQAPSTSCLPVQGQPKEAEWLSRAGMQSMLALPCHGEDGVCAVLVLATKQQYAWSTMLLGQLQQLAYNITPFAVEAGKSLDDQLNVPRPRRFQSSNDIAASVMDEMINLDRILAASLTASSMAAMCSSNSAPVNATTQAPAPVVASQEPQELHPAPAAAAAAVPEPVWRGVQPTEGCYKPASRITVAPRAQPSDSCTSSSYTSSCTPSQAAIPDARLMLAEPQTPQGACTPHPVLTHCVQGVPSGPGTPSHSASQQAVLPLHQQQCQQQETSPPQSMAMDMLTFAMASSANAVAAGSSPVASGQLTDSARLREASLASAGLQRPSAGGAGHHAVGAGGNTAGSSAPTNYSQHLVLLRSMSSMCMEQGVDSMQQEPFSMFAALQHEESNTDMARRLHGSAAYVAMLADASNFKERGSSAPLSMERGVVMPGGGFYEAWHLGDLASRPACMAGEEHLHAMHGAAHAHVQLPSTHEFLMTQGTAGHPTHMEQGLANNAGFLADDLTGAGRGYQSLLGAPLVPEHVSWSAIQQPTHSGDSDGFPVNSLIGRMAVASNSSRSSFQSSNRHLANTAAWQGNLSLTSNATMAPVPA
uniref:GAF domain-containing protein n=1 Tax=Chlamydomonas leiostraca TaxID=1034604 RepID=A0A7S0WLX5_9CHLO|mmetsp:Transcript_18491/g.46830  ORF Transcript_18491/g.46830 Transcript_18491/m.46830 type:complete len:636 (+) Transcript_18491:544-2451(+)